MLGSNAGLVCAGLVFYHYTVPQSEVLTRLQAGFSSLVLPPPSMENTALHPSLGQDSKEPCWSREQPSADNVTYP